ncbi:MAG TPA: aldo/keto reductase [Solirubrobacterales bacterium]|nr:aldo/keto reductase [Solirubrobacterales bacterium]
MSAPATDLPTRRIGDGHGSLEVSVIGLGCSNFGGRLDRDGTAAVIDAALDAGITLFDTADVYGGSGGSESLIGEAVEGRREEVVIATKFGMDMRGDDVPAAPKGSRDYIRWAVEGSLRRLRTDHIDLYQLHYPDGFTPIAETLTALNELVAEGLVSQIGCSNFDADRLEAAEAAARESGLARFVTAQNEYSLLERGVEAELAPLCERLGVGIIPYFPLASGLLTGKYGRHAEPPYGARLRGRETVATEAQFDVLDRVADYAAARDVAMLDVAIAGLAAQPAVRSVIAGASRPEQVRANVAASLWSPSEDDLRELDRLTGHHE